MLTNYSQNKAEQGCQIAIDVARIAALGRVLCLCGHHFETFILTLDLLSFYFIWNVK